MARLLILIAFAALAWWLWRRITRPRRQSATPPTPAEPMVRCAHCGLHLPRKEALAEDERWYCSEAHRDADRSSRAD